MEQSDSKDLFRFSDQVMRTARPTYSFGNFFLSYAETRHKTSFTFVDPCQLVLASLPSL